MHTETTTTSDARPAAEPEGRAASIDSQEDVARWVAYFSPYLFWGVVVALSCSLLIF